MDALVGILLVVRTRPGPKIIHCHPLPAQRLSRRQRKGEPEQSDSDSDVDVNGIASLQRGRKAKPSQESTRPTLDAGPEVHGVAEGDILGFCEDSLESLLAPGVWSDKKKFEVCLDGLTFVGHPIHAYEDGRWTRREARGFNPMHHAASEMDDKYGDYTHYGIAVTEPTSPIRMHGTAHNFEHITESFNSQLGRSLGTTSMNSASSSSTTGAQHLTMFNVVLVFDTPGDSSDQNFIPAVYIHIIKKLSKALHYCQQQSNYVGTAIRTLQALYAKAKQDRVATDAVQQEVLETSELAWAMKEVYDSIITGKVAGVRLNGQAVSLQVPLKSTEDEEKIGLSSHAGLLLLEDKGALLRELSHPEASPLAHFIREHTPTKSLQKLAPRLSMSIQEVLYLARHLTRWRKARPITPLHPQNTYIVHEHVPTDRLSELATAYARNFPGLPSLPQMLKFLSARPVKYGMLMPSRDHRTPYMDILAYLVRHELVMQLKTYGWLVRIAPRKQVKQEKASVDRNRVPLSVASLLSPQLRAVDDDVVSVSSDRTAIPLDAVEKDVKLLAFKESPPEFADTTEIQDPWNIIAHTTEPSAEDSEFLRNIQEAISDEELRDRLDSLLKYFNGDEALEEIAAREGFKRSQVERWLDIMQKDGLIRTFRHA